MARVRGASDRQTDRQTDRQADKETLSFISMDFGVLAWVLVSQGAALYILLCKRFNTKCMQ